MHEKREQTTISYDLSNWNSDLRRGRPISPQGSTVVVLFPGFITELTKGITGAIHVRFLT